MYRPNYPKNQTPAQVIEFSSLRKLNPTISAKHHQHTLLLKFTTNLPIIFISAFSLLQQPATISNQQFSDFTFEQVPKPFQLYQHEKTMCEILNIVKAKTDSLQSLVEIINNYPIVTYVLQCWARSKAKTAIESGASSDLMGNEIDLLNDLGVQIRGPLLGMIAGAFGMSIRIRFGQRAENEQQNIETYSSQNCKFQLALDYIPDGFSLGQLHEKQLQNTLSNNKSSECGYLRRSKVVDSEQDSHTSGTEFKSVKKDKMGQCQKCGNGKKCDCNTIKRKGFGVTPKSNQLSNSSSNGFKNEPFNMGFLNANNISRIRDNRPK